MKNAFRCSCNTVYPDEYVRQWGVNGIGSGYGSRAVCTAVWPNERTGGGEVCRGELAPITVEDNQVEEILIDLNDRVRFARPFAFSLPAPTAESPNRRELRTIEALAVALEPQKADPRTFL